jgi:predicted DNA-binding transcriptional regulator AlpA
MNPSTLDLETLEGLITTAKTKLEQGKALKAISDEGKSLGVPILLTAKDISPFLGISTSVLANRRDDGDGPRFIKLGKATFYEPYDVFDWVASRKYQSTAEAKVNQKRKKATISKPLVSQ